MNSERFLQRESIVYARATLAASRVFQASSARRTFCIALSRVNGGKGGRPDVVAVAMISSPGIASFGISINSRARAAICAEGAVIRILWPCFQLFARLFPVRFVRQPLSPHFRV